MLTLFTPNPLPALFLTNIYIFTVYYCLQLKENVCIDVPKPQNLWFSTLLSSLICWAGLLVILSTSSLQISYREIEF